MNTKSNKIAAIVAAVIATVCIANAQPPVMMGKVPVAFEVKGVAAAAGTYRVHVMRPGMIAVQTENGRNVSAALMAVKTADASDRSTMTFEQHHGVYELAGYCKAGAGCWKSFSNSSRPAERTMEIALLNNR